MSWIQDDGADFDIRISIKPESQWIEAIDPLARRYLRAQNYPPTLENQTLAAIGEVLERLVMLSVLQGCATPFELGFKRQDEAVQVHLSYDASIPLNPLRESTYEVPSAGAADAGTLDGLWLHIVKRTMDRVFFRLEGQRASLVMLKYFRPEEQARQAWVMNLAPKLRADIILERGAPEPAGEDSRTAVLHDIQGKTVIKLPASNAFIVERLDGRRSLGDIYLEHAEAVGPISPRQVRQLYETLEAAGMLERHAAGQTDSASRWRRLLNPVFSLPNSDRLVTEVYRHIRWLFHPFGVALLLLTGLYGAASLFWHWHAVAAVFVAADAQLLQQPALLAAVYLVMLVHTGLHELAHGTACKHFGGNVPRIGVMWYMAMFIFFCDTTSAWNFPRKSQRIWVSLAGPLLSWAFFGVGAVFAAASATAGSAGAVFWVTLTLFNAFGLIMNFNPFIRMDAYYILVDWTGIANLQPKSFAYLKQLLLRENRQTPSDEAKPSLREKRIYLSYGIGSALMSLLFLVLPFWELSRLWLSHRYLSFEGAMALSAAVLIFAGILFKGYGMIHQIKVKEYKIS